MRTRTHAMRCLKPQGSGYEIDSSVLKPIAMFFCLAFFINQFSNLHDIASRRLSLENLDHICFRFIINYLEHAHPASWYLFSDVFSLLTYLH